MRTSISKKLLAGALSVMMVLSLFAGVPANKAQAASYSLKQKDGLTKMYSGSTYTYNVTGVKKGQYVKISRNYTSTKVTAKENGKTKTLKAGKKGSLKLDGTGKNLSFSVKLAAKNIIYTNKVTVKVYSKAGKVVKTLTKSAKVYKKTTAVELDKTEATLKIGETVTLTATKTPAKCTRSITWATSDASVATVEGGVVTAVAAGTATITAKSGSKTATATIVVNDELKMTAKQSGAKKITVSFTKDVKEAKAEITVKRGASSVNVSEIEYTSNDTVVLTMAANIVSDSEYTVTAKVGEETLEATFKGETSKVSEIKILSDKAIMNGDGQATVTATFAVYNQFGEDLTKTTQVTITSNGGNNTATKPGVYTSTVATFDATINNKLTLSIVDPNTGVSAVATLTVVSKAYVAKVEFVGLYNKDGKTLDEDTNLTKDAFYLEITGKDQYDNVLDMTAYNADLLMSETNTTVADYDGTTTPVIVKIPNTTDRYGIALVSITKPGTTMMLLTSKYNGAQATFTTEVAEAKRAYDVVLGQPEAAIAGENVYIPLTVTDKEGNAITTLATVKNASRGVTVTTAATAAIVKEEGNLYIVLSGITAEAYVSVTAQCATSYKTATTTIHVLKKAVPVGIVSYSGAKASSGATDATGLKLTQLSVEDQYGRTLNKNSAAWAGLFNSAAAEGNYRVVAKSEDSSFLTLPSNPDWDVLTGSATTITRVALGTAKIELKIQTYTAGGWKDVNGSNYEYGFTFTDGSEYTSYTVAEIPTIYVKLGTVDNETGAVDAGGYFSAAADNSYNRKVVVYGVLANGAKVALTKDSEYSLSSTDAVLSADFTADGIIGNNLDYAQADFGWEDAAHNVPKTELKTSFDVTINSTTEVINVPVTVSTVLPKVKTIEAYNLAENELKTIEITTPLTANYSGQDILDNYTYFWVIDQYGVYSKVDDLNKLFTAAGAGRLGGTLTVTKTSGTINVTGNKTAAAEIVAATPGATATLTYAFGDVKIDVDVLFEEGVGALSSTAETVITRFDWPSGRTYTVGDASEPPTDFNALRNALGSTVTAHLASGGTVSLDVTWTDTDTYNAITDGDYTVTGAVTTIGYTLDGGLSANHEVEVRVAGNS